MEITNILQSLERMKEKMTSTAGLSNVQGLLEKLDPHKICEIDNMCRIHDDQIGKLEKKLMELLDVRTLFIQKNSKASRVENDPL